MAKRLNNLNIKDKVKMGMHQVKEEEPQQIIWHIVAKNHECEPAYPENSITLQTQKVIDIRAFDALEPSNPDTYRKTRGNNRFSLSNIRQWLNSNAEAGKWYTPQHIYDAPPDSAEVCDNVETYYFQRAGFLSRFTEKESKKILDTTIRTALNTTVDGGGYEDIVTKVFLPSKTELGVSIEGSIAEGAPWAAYTDDQSRITSLTEECFNNVNCTTTVMPASASAAMAYIMRTVTPSNTFSISLIDHVGGGTNFRAFYGDGGIRPVLNLPSDTLVSDEPDEDGCYTLIFDEPPIIAATPSGDLGACATPLNKTYTITDHDGDSMTVTEKLNGEVIRTLLNQPSGEILSLDLTSKWQILDIDTPHTATIEVTDGILTTTHEWTFIRTNAAPTITAESNGDVGKLAIPFKQEYTVNDPNMNTLSVIEKLDGQAIRTLSAQPSGTKITFDLKDFWQSLSKDSSHTAAIEVTDGLLTASHSWTFSVIDPIEQHITSNRSTAQPTSIIIPVLPIQVLAANNANDIQPTWEDASKEYQERKQYSFKNNTKTADEWCVGVKYTVNGISVPVKLTTMHEYKF